MREGRKGKSVSEFNSGMSHIFLFLGQFYGIWLKDVTTRRFSLSSSVSGAMSGRSERTTWKPACSAAMISVNEKLARKVHFMPFEIKGPGKEYLSRYH
jgi:hypothetical protein